MDSRHRDSDYDVFQDTPNTPLDEAFNFRSSSASILVDHQQSTTPTNKKQNNRR